VTYPFARDYARVDRVPHALRRLAAMPARLLHPDHPLGRKLRRLPLGVLERHLEAMSFFVPSELGRITTPALGAALRGHDPYRNQREHFARAAAAGDPVAALLHVDAMTYMADDVLMKVDKASMLHSLEVRVPLLDHRVLEFVAGIPFEYKLRGEVGKWILRESVRDLLPPEILARGKQGFGMPIDRWLGGTFGALAREVLTDPRARGRGWFDPAAVERVLADPAQRAERRARQTWSLVCLELWARTYLDRGRDELVAPLAPLGREPVAA
jgi:asparagine synthase (glutamine-hydrolysing)